MMTLIAVQEAYIDTLNAGIARWSHRPRLQWSVGGGHAQRTARAARRTAEKQLRRLGFTDQRQIDQIIADARDMAALVRLSEVE